MSIPWLRLDAIGEVIRKTESRKSPARDRKQEQERGEDFRDREKLRAGKVPRRTASTHERQGRTSAIEKTESRKGPRRIRELPRSAKPESWQGLPPPWVPVDRPVRTLFYFPIFQKCSGNTFLFSNFSKVFRGRYFWNTFVFSNFSKVLKLCSNCVENVLKTYFGSTFLFSNFTKVLNSFFGKVF